MDLVPITIVLGSIVAITVMRLMRIGKRPPSFPPGPPTTPVLGNLLMFPRENAYLKFTQWAREFGGMFSLMMFDNPIVVISDPRLVKELIEKKGGSVADRPHSHLINMVTEGKYLTFARYSNDWRTARTMLQKALTKEACLEYLPIMQAEAIQLLFNMMTTPDNFFPDTTRFAYSVAATVLTGTRAPSSESPILKKFFHMIEEWSGLLEPGSQPPLDLIPVLKYIPARWAKWKDLCADIRRQQYELYDGFVTMCEKRIANNLRNGSLLEGVIADQKLGNDRVLIRGTIGAFLEGGTDTTSLFLKSLILMLTSSPDAQTKAHKEIDAVVGSDRLPTLSDFNDLPYCQAIMKEVLRIRPMVPIGVPHNVTKEEVIDGYVIPVGSTVFMNQFGILHDPEAYDDPDLFIPDRFITSQFGTKPGANVEGRGNETHFGAGRRVCVGMNLANNAMITNTMNFLWAFDFKPANDPATGRPIPVDINNYSEGIATSPRPFKCDIRPRSPTHAALIRKELLAARPIFERYEHELSPEEAQYAVGLGA
ncbi:cytochrome P450 [Dendrothele bispora CBS 962.96]|uniref:Cytochrome P450 n=1 Tax=Dendrothele bispora (strain CBS 962.96) TaxID=1314807 RepID=A0A4S8LI35_DENBC|nr:cytochrome P450 [Dendrothele bispora CBS 962.96]